MASWPLNEALTTADTAQTFATHHNDLAGWANDFQADLEVRYVSTAAHASDSNDGYSWATAKATGKSAYDSLPARGGTRDWNYGRIVYGRGKFTEPTWPIGKIGDLLMIEGQGTGFRDQTRGTLVVPDDVAGNDGQPFLAAGNDTGTDVWNHHVIVKDLTIAGGYTGSTNLTTQYDGLLEYRSPGMNCQLFNVHLADANAYGIYIHGNAETMSLYNPGCGRLERGFLWAGNQNQEISGNSSLPNSIGVYGGQFDAAQPQNLNYAWFDVVGRGTSPNKTLLLNACTFEGGVTDGKAAAQHTPTSNQGWDITLIGCNYWGGVAGSRLIYEAAGAGNGVDAVIINSYVSSGDVFETAKHSVTSGVGEVRVMEYTAGEPAVVNLGGTQQVYTPTNDVTSRSFDANSVDVAGLADVVATMLRDGAAKGIWSV